MGTHEPIREGEFEKCAQMYQDSIANDPSSIWLAVRDYVSGKIVGGCNWKLYVNAAEKGTDRETKRPSWLEGEDLEFSNMICGDSSQARREAMPGPHAYLHICFTDAAYRRRGAGSMMLQWGVDVADLLHIPAYIEAYGHVAIAPEDQVLTAWAQVQGR